MVRGIHNIEWLTPDDGEPEPTVPSDLDGVTQISAISRVRLRTAGRWHYLDALLLLGGFLLALSLTHPYRAPPDPRAPAWSLNWPLSAQLSPFMASACSHGNCHATPPSVTDIRHMRAGLDDTFVVSGDRVLDRPGHLRGLDVRVTNAQADKLAITAVQVPKAPSRWDGQSASVKKGSLRSRWVLTTTNQVWLIESSASLGKCDRDLSTYVRLYNMALERVPASQLSL